MNTNAIFRALGRVPPAARVPFVGSTAARVPPQASIIEVVEYECAASVLFRRRLRDAMMTGDVTGACTLLRTLRDPEERLWAYTAELCERCGIQSEAGRAHMLNLVRRRLAAGEAEVDDPVLYGSFDDGVDVWAALGLFD